MIAIENVTMESHGPVALVRFDRRGARNAFNQQTIVELTDVARRFQDDLETQAVVLTGTREAFSGGIDLKERASRAVTAAGPLRNGKFAIIDSSVFSQLSSPAQIALYVRITMHQRAKAPQFYLPIQPGKGTRMKLRKPWFTAATKLSKILGQQYLICPEIDRMSERVPYAASRTNVRYHERAKNL